MIDSNKNSSHSYVNVWVVWLFLLILLVVVTGFYLVNNTAWIETQKYITRINEYLQNACDKIVVDAKAATALKQVIIKGAVRTDFNELETTIGLNSNEIVTDIDIALIQKRVKALPWVEDVIVQRIFPDTVIVQVTEHVPVALWQNDGKYFVINDKGKVVDENAKILDTDEIPLIVGTGAPQKTLRLLFDLSQNPEVFSRLKSAVLVDGRRWDLILDDIDKPLVIRLPEGDEVDALKRLKKLQEKYAILKRKLTLIDLRLGERLLVRL